MFKYFVMLLAIGGVGLFLGLTSFILSKFIGDNSILYIFPIIFWCIVNIKVVNYFEKN